MNIYPAVAAITGDLGFDPDTLHAKYLAERDRRIRAAMGADLARARLAASRLRQQREGDLIADALLAAGGEQ